VLVVVYLGVKDKVLAFVFPRVFAVENVNGGFDLHGVLLS
jgi:hypothetical protein